MAEAKDAEKKPAEKTSAAKKSATVASKTTAEKKPAAKAATAKKAAAPKAEPVAEVAEDKVELVRVHHLKPAPGSRKAKTRVGRGEGSKGKTAGRGTKGTGARKNTPVGFEGGQMPMHMRLPKLRGFKNPFRVEYQVVNLDKLSEVFPKGGTVGVEELVAKGLVRPKQLVKVLGSGETTTKFDLSVDAWSSSAQTKIEAAGGSITKR